jgi:uncharacterized protein (UPF0548 family)
VTGRNLTYPDPGATRPGDERWSRPAGSRYRSFERTVVLGSGDRLWRSASAALMEWGVKTRSGFRVESTSGDAERPASVRAGRDSRLIALLGPVRVREPVRVVAVVDTPDRRGFAYGTLDGHPVSGEEAFVLLRTDGVVRLTLRSLTRAGSGVWRAAFPLALLAQRWYRRRYSAALRS